MKNNEDNHTNTPTRQKEDWFKFFALQPDAFTNSQYEQWQTLWDKQARLETFVKQELLLQDLIPSVEKLQGTLDYKKPFKIVFVGETGAGKSTFINALMGQKVVSYGGGGAVTGVPIYIHPGESEDPTEMSITYRSESEFIDLICNLLRINGEPAADLRAKGMGAIAVQNEENQQWVKDFLQGQSPSDIESTKKDIKEVISAWQSVKSNNLLGKKDPNTNIGKLKELTEERSQTNRTDRRIVGIKKADIFFGKEIGETALKNIVYVDAPGLGALTRRHTEVLREEAREADAIVLVVGDTRPDRYMKDINELVQDIFLDGLAQGNKLAQNLLSKVFLVVNRQGNASEEDRERFRDSINGIWNLLYAKLKPSSPVERTHYEVVADKAMFARLRLADQSLEEEEKKRYNKYVQELGEHTNVFEALLNTSGILEFEKAITYFLSEKRIEDILDGANARLANLIAEIKSVLKQHLTDNGIDLVLDEKLNQQFEKGQENRCYEQIKKDYADLAKRYTAKRDAFFKKKVDQNELMPDRKPFNTIMEGIIQRCYERFVQPDGDYDNQTFDYNTGDYHKEALIKKFLTDAESEVRRGVAKESVYFSDFYANLFETHFSKNFFETLFASFTYEQAYIINELNPVNRVEQVKSEMKQKFQESCRACLEYEMIKHSITQNTEMITKLNETVASGDTFSEKLIQAFKEQYESSVVKALPILQNMYFYDIKLLSTVVEDMSETMKRQHEQNFKELKSTLLTRLGGTKEIVQAVIDCYVRFQGMIGPRMTND